MRRLWTARSPPLSTCSLFPIPYSLFATRYSLISTSLTTHDSPLTTHHSPSPMDQPRWLELAWADLGVAEGPGDANNPTVVRYYADTGHPEVRADEVAWCAAFVRA